MSYEESAVFSLPIPPRVKIGAITRFLGGGHGYNWITISQAPVRMELGRSSRSGLPDLVIVGRTLYSNESSQSFGERLRMVLDHLDRQAGGGV